jgi:hypothetical protein
MFTRYAWIHTQANEKDAKLVFNMDEREQRDK